MQKDVRKKKLRMLVDRLAYHLTVNAIQNGGMETFFSERYYTDDNELFKFITSTAEHRTAQMIVRHWLKKQESNNDNDGVDRSRENDRRPVGRRERKHGDTRTTDRGRST